MISIALLGFGKVGQQVYEKLKAVPGYAEEFRIHAIHVPDISKYPTAFTPEMYHAVNDETFGTAKQVAIGSDEEWLVESEGHDTIVDCTPYTPESMALVLKLLAKGHSLHTCSKGLVSAHWVELCDLIKKSGNTKIYFNSIPASKEPCKFDDIELTSDTFSEYADSDLYSYRGAGPSETAEYIVKDIIKQIESRRESKRLWDAMSPEEQEKIRKADQQV